MSDRGDDNLAALAHQAQRLADISSLGHIGGDDARVRKLTTCQFDDHTERLVDGSGGVGRAEVNRPDPFSIDGIHRDIMALASGFRALNRVAADSTHAQYDDGIPRPN